MVVHKNYHYAFSLETGGNPLRFFQSNPSYITLKDYKPKKKKSSKFSNASKGTVMIINWCGKSFVLVGVKKLSPPLLSIPRDDLLTVPACKYVTADVTTYYIFTRLLFNTRVRNLFLFA